MPLRIPPGTPCARLVAGALTLLVAAAGAGCGRAPEAPAADFAARVGDQVLTEAEVREALAPLPAGLDSATARQQVIEQWVTGELLAQEARRQGLLTRTDVRRQLAESERSVLAAALIESFFEANPAEPTPAEERAYFARYRADLALREPYVRLRHLRVPSQARAAQAATALRPLDASVRGDSLWRMAVRAYTPDEATTTGALALAAAYLPESRLTELDEALARRVAALQPGQTAEPFASGNAWHAVQLVDRQPAGTAPQFAWVRDEIRQRLAIEQRRQMLARQVQQLRSQAQARDQLDVR